LGVTIPPPDKEVKVLFKMLHPRINDNTMPRVAMVAITDPGASLVCVLMFMDTIGYNKNP
jgi:hypothetical protein